MHYHSQIAENQSFKKKNSESSQREKHNMEEKISECQKTSLQKLCRLNNNSTTSLNNATFFNGMETINLEFKTQPKHFRNKGK